MPQYLTIVTMTLCLSATVTAQDTPAPTEDAGAAPAKAQETQDTEDAESKGEAVEKGGKQGRGKQAGPLAGQTRRIKQSLRLTDEQSAQFDAMVEKARAERKEQQAGAGRALAEARAARAQSNSERFEQAVARLRAIASPAAGKVLDELATILTDEQKPRLERVRQRFQEVPKPAAPVIMEAMVRLRGDARIRKEQATDYDAIVTRLCNSLDPSPRTREVDEDEIADILAELTEAVASGDEDRIRGIRGRLVHEQAEPFDALISGILDIDAILKDPQREALADFVVSIPSLPKTSRQPRDASVLVQLTRECKPTTEQRAQLKAIEQMPVDRANPATAARDLYAVYVRILDVLTDEQWDQFEQAIASNRRPAQKKSGD